MANIDDKTAASIDLTYPIYNIQVRQGVTDPILTLRIADTNSESGFATLTNLSFVGSVVVSKPTGREENTSAQLEFRSNGIDSDVVYCYIPVEFTNGLNPYVNRPVKCLYDVWQSTDGVTPYGTGVIGGVISVRERITRNARVGSGDVNTNG